MYAKYIKEYYMNYYNRMGHIIIAIIDFEIYLSRKIVDFQVINYKNVNKAIYILHREY